MMYEEQEIPVLEHSELIDMRTHLTVAMLAASQLNRRTKDLPETAHLQTYLDQSLKSLVDDVVRVDALVAQTDEGVSAKQKRGSHRLAKPARWGFGIVKRCVCGFCEWIHRRRLVRLTVSYPYL